MSDGALQILRWVLLASGIISLLQATLLFRLVQHWLIRPWAALNERLGRPLPPLIVSGRFQRLWPLLMAGLFLGAWWYLGSPDGARLVQGSIGH